MKTTLFPLVFAFMTMAALTASAEEPLRIKRAGQGTSAELIQVGNAWRKDCPRRYEVVIRSEKDLPLSQVKLKAYYFDGNNRLIETLDKPSEVWRATSKGYEGVGLPATIQANKDATAYFPITPEMKEKKMRTVVFVLSDGANMVAKAEPSTNMTVVEFPEKATAKIQ